MKEIDLNKLLNRPPVEINTQEIESFIKGKRILITGASGSIGSELVMQIAKYSPRYIVLFDHNENNQFFLERKLKELYPELKTIPRLGSITDRERVSTVFQETIPDIVFHAAANKHVPLSEANPSECIQNNVEGTIVVASCAQNYNCESFVLISTDKAVNPTSVMGCTKRLCELYIQHSSVGSSTRFVTVRFGNVLGSNGSVVPIFQQQIENMESVKVTHPDMYRYFMTIPEAVNLLLQASIFGKSGEIYVLDMGEQVKIVDLAKALIEMYGNGNPIEFTGLRPGEKINEELLFDFETTKATNNPKIRSTLTLTPTPEKILQIYELLRLPYNTPANVLKQKLASIINEAKLEIPKFITNNDGSFTLN